MIVALICVVPPRVCEFHMSLLLPRFPHPVCAFVLSPHLLLHSTSKLRSIKQPGYWSHGKDGHSARSSDLTQPEVKPACWVEGTSSWMQLLFRLPWTHAACDVMYDLVRESAASVWPRGNLVHCLLSFYLTGSSQHCRALEGQTLLVSLGFKWKERHGCCVWQTSTRGKWSARWGEWVLALTHRLTHGGVIKSPGESSKYENTVKSVRTFSSSHLQTTWNICSKLSCRKQHEEYFLYEGIQFLRRGRRIFIFIVCMQPALWMHERTEVYLHVDIK